MGLLKGVHNESVLFARLGPAHRHGQRLLLPALQRRKRQGMHHGKRVVRRTTPHLFVHPSLGNQGQAIRRKPRRTGVRSDFLKIKSPRIRAIGYNRALFNIALPSMFQPIVRLALAIWMRLPFGHICRVHHGTSHMTLRKDFWIIVSDGNTTDALPINAVSHHLQNEFALRMKAIGYNVDAYFDHKGDAQTVAHAAVMVHPSKPELVRDTARAQTNK